MNYQYPRISTLGSITLNFWVLFNLKFKIMTQLTESKANTIFLVSMLYFASGFIHTCWLLVIWKQAKIFTIAHVYKNMQYCPNIAGFWEISIKATYPSCYHAVFISSSIKIRECAQDQTHVPWCLRWTFWLRNQLLLYFPLYSLSHKAAVQTISKWKNQITKTYL